MGSWVSNRSIYLDEGYVSSKCPQATRRHTKTEKNISGREGKDYCSSPTRAKKFRIGFVSLGVAVTSQPSTNQPHFSPFSKLQLPKPRPHIQHVKTHPRKFIASTLHLISLTTAAIAITHHLRTHTRRKLAIGNGASAFSRGPSGHPTGTLTNRAGGAG
jgi:hypothetical protein